VYVRNYPRNLKSRILTESLRNIVIYTNSIAEKEVSETG